MIGPARRLRGIGLGEQPEAGVLEELLEFTPDAILIVDDRGHIMRANTAAEQMFGYGPGELAGKAVETLLPERFRKKHAEHRATYKAKPYRRPMGSELELCGRTKDGDEFPVDITATKG